MLLDEAHDLRRTPAPSNHGVQAGLSLAAQLTSQAAQPGSGSTLRRWDLLARLAAADLVVARIVEAHLDAVAIIAEADVAAELREHLAVDERSTWGVYAAEGPQSTLTATRDAHGSYTLTGTKPWCSLAGRVTHALITAGAGDQRRLFAVRLGLAPDAPDRAAGIVVHSGGWHSRGLATVPSEPVQLTRVPAVPVGEPNWYLERPGFAYGGLGVAACWYGGLVGLVESARSAAAHRPPDQLALWHLGADDLDEHLARCALTHAAAEVDAGRATGAAGQTLALRTRSVVADAAERVLTRSGHARGPAPLTFDDEHAQRVADLTVYLRQHHAERDVATLGAMLHERGPAAR